MPTRSPPKPGPIQDFDDPQRRRWGGLSEQDGRKLNVQLVEVGEDEFYFNLVVSSTDESKLKGPVRFHLHDSFQKSVQTIKRIRDDGTILWGEIDAYETFTVAAQVKTHSGKWVGLEYDLALLAVHSPGRKLPLRFIPNSQRPFIRWLKQRKTSMIPGIALKDLYTQILSAFDLASLGREVQFRMNVNLANVVDVHASLEEIVFELLQWADRQGRMGELVRELADARPNHAGMQAVVRQYARLLTPSTDPREYVHFFDDKPAVSLQEGGVTKGVTPVQDAGFELTRNKALGFFDATFFAEMLAHMSRRVCRVELNDDGDRMGTAFLVGPQAVLTNYHVLESVIEKKSPANKVKFRFDYFRATPTSAPSEGVLVGLDGASDASRPWLLGHAKYSAGEAHNSPDSPPPEPSELDYALVRLDRAIGNEANGKPRGWIEIPAAPPSLDGAPLLMILQHPNREPIKLAFDSDPKVEEKFGGRRVRYQVNTEGGSSGSPVFDKDWQLAALHHYGDPTWHAAYNQGVPIGLIRDHLSVAARQALGAKFEALPRLEVSAASTAALSKRFESGTAGVSRGDVEAIIKTAAATAVADPQSFVLNMSESVREAIERKIKKADDEWQQAFEDSDDPVKWQIATNRKRKLICAALSQGKQQNGGELPDDWVKLWIDLNCGV